MQNCCIPDGVKVRHSMWFRKHEVQDSRRKCHGEIIRQICHLSAEDLPEFRSEAGNRTITANKFDLDVDAVAVVCQAKDIVQRTRASLVSWEED